jgi:hypothetical protein
MSCRSSEGIRDSPQDGSRPSVGHAPFPPHLAQTRQADEADHPDVLPPAARPVPAFESVSGERFGCGSGEERPTRSVLREDVAAVGAQRCGEEGHSPNGTVLFFLNYDYPMVRLHFSIEDFNRFVYNSERLYQLSLAWERIK